MLHNACCITLKGEVYKYLNVQFLPHKRHTAFLVDILFRELTICCDSYTDTYIYCVLLSNVKAVLHVVTTELDTCSWRTR